MILIRRRSCSPAWARRLLTLALALPLAACAAEPRLEPLQRGSIERLSGFGELTLASQPSAEDLADAAGSGLRTVVDLRGPAEDRGFDEPAVAGELGLTYLAIPIAGAEGLTDAAFEAGLEALSSGQRPLMMHCASANRVGALWLAWRALEGGLDVEQAAAEARTVGLRSPELEQRARDYVAARAEL